jgi:outer membrane autotransporter protein
VGRLDSEIREDRFSSSGETNVFSLGLKRRSGRWEFGASAAYGSGSFDNRRLLRLPGQAEEAINSDADVDVLALRARSSYEFGLSDWAYLRPSVALDVVRSEVGRIREGRDASFALDVEGPERSDVALTTGVQIGAFTRSGNNVLRGYVDAGWRYAPDAGGELHGRLLSTDGSDISARLDPADSTGVLKVGAQWLSARRLDLRLEYGLEDSGGYRRQSATARLGWVF